VFSEALCQIRVTGPSRPALTRRLSVPAIQPAINNESLAANRESRQTSSVSAVEITCSFDRVLTRHRDG